MNNKNLIIQLIIQELKHHRLILGLRNLGFESDIDSFSLFEIILPLLGIEVGPDQDYTGVLEKLYNTYYEYLDKVEEYPINSLNKDLEPLAKISYESLINIIKLEFL
jgi:hypothetical protein